MYTHLRIVLAERLRTLAFERSKGKRKRVTRNDLRIEAVERFLNAEVFKRLAARDGITMAQAVERALDLYASK